MTTSSSTTPLQATSPDQQQSLPIALMDLVCAVVLLAGFLPLVSEYFANLWTRPHYQFFVFLPLVAVWFARRDIVDEFSLELESGLNGFRKIVPPAGQTYLGSVVLFIAAGMLIVASLITSPWLSYVGFLFALPGLAVMFGGARLLRTLLSAWVVFALALSLPGNFDLRLISKLREVTTQASSLILERLGVLHLVTGNVFELPEKPLFVADACTGIHSLYVLVATAVIIGLMERRGLVHVLLLMGMSFVVVLVENVVRVAGIAWAVSAGIGLDTGWKHEVFGILLFALSLGTVLSADQFLMAFHRPAGHVTGLFRGIFSERLNKTKSSGRKGSPRLRSAVELVWLKGSLRMFALFGFGVGAWQLVEMPTRAEHLGMLMQKHPVQFASLDKGFLPDFVDGWRCEAFEVVERVRDDPMGEFSQIWTYVRGEERMVVSLDYPYSRLHDLSSCYQGIGWRRVKRGITTPVDHRLKVATVRFARANFGDALLFYTMIDVEGNSEVKFKDQTDLVDVFTKRVDEGVPWFQIQMFWNQAGSVDSANEEQMRNLFMVFAEQIRENCLQSLGKEGLEKSLGKEGLEKSRE